MENQPGVSFGSGGQLLGGVNASQLLGMPGGTMQQSPASAGYTPGILPPPPGQAPQQPQGFQQSPSTPPMMPPQMPQQPQQPQQGVVGTPPGPSETMMILKALIERQKLLGEHEKSVRDTLMPPQNNT